MNQEQLRLKADREEGVGWKKWGRQVSKLFPLGIDAL
jgi:hypothetical protein